MHTPAIAAATPEVGRRLLFLGQTLTVRATGRETGGRLAVIEFLAPPGSAAPPHVHSREDEWFYILEGRLEVRVGDEVRVARAGDFAVLPRGVPHAYAVPAGAPARFLGAAEPAGFEAFFGELAVPASGGGPSPDDGVPDPAALVATAARYGVEVLGGPPA